MRKVMRMAAVGALMLVFAADLRASENIVKFFERFDDDLITQGEWATYLVKAIGDDDKVPTSSSTIDFIALLEKNRVAPLDGWQESEYLTFGDKAVTMMQALGLSDQLPADAEALDYVWYLESMGFHEGLPTQLVRKTEALNRNINDPIYQELAGTVYNINISEFAPSVPMTSASDAR